MYEFSMGPDTRNVGSRGQVTIPKELREQFGIHGGDEAVRREDGKVVIEASVIEHRIGETLGPIPDDRMEQVGRALEYRLGLDGAG